MPLLLKRESAESRIIFQGRSTPGKKEDRVFIVQNIPGFPQLQQTGQPRAAGGGYSNPGSGAGHMVGLLNHFFPQDLRLAPGFERRMQEMKLVVDKFGAENHAIDRAIGMASLGDGVSPAEF
jgi:hypothetical protein